MSNQVRVGLGVLVLKQGRVLIGTRKNSHGAGLPAFPGGHQEYMETWKECAEREVKEETGMTVRFRYFDHRMYQPYLFVTDNLMTEWDRHYNTVFVVCDWIEGNPEIKEPDKCEGWGWYTWEELLKILPENAIKEWQDNWHMEYPTSDDMSHHWLPLRQLEAYRPLIGWSRN